jgi:glycogen debranching enzyme
VIRPGPFLLLALSTAAFGQSSLAPLPTIPEFPLYPPNQPVISRDIDPLHPFSVVGPRGTILGSQDGSYEAWIFPWKILSNMRISAEMKDYPVPIDVNLQAAAIDVRPGSTTITFSHANFTIREIITAPRNVPDGAGALVFYQIEAVRPMTLTFSFTPIMVRMWPAPSAGPPGPEWVPTRNQTGNSSGFYILHLNFPDHAAGIAMPTAEPGIMQPYQELARVYPLQFVLHFDPARDTHTLFPLLLTRGNTPETASRDGLYKQLSVLDSSARSIYEEQQKYENDFLSSNLSIDTPDQQLNDAFKWSEVSIDQLRVQTVPSHDEEALTAGFVGSGDSARPGFGWFFGRDALWTLYAVNSYGDYNVTRREIEFLIKRQRDDGKIMHEWSQTASLVDWKSLPYEYAAADATLLFPMALNDYLSISGDQAFINTHWPSIARAWNFVTTHDSDGDGIYDNSQGTGWVESWIPSMPHQEIYMAALDEQASLAFANLARATGHADLALAAESRAAHIRSQLEKEYFHSDFYSFSWNANNTTDDTATIFPSVAWWDGTYSLDHPQPMFSRWASAEFSTDWGTRIVSDRTSFYDPISYHQGTVWPLYTGWVSLAEYRAGRTLSAYAHLRQNADLIWAQDLGNATELLSGQFFQPLGRSTAHQLWSAAMIISPILRGLFGLEWNAAANELTVTPSLPADWDHATLSNIPIGQQRVSIQIKRENGMLLVSASGPTASQIHLKSRAPGAKLTNGALQIPLPAVEVGLTQDLPEAGASTQQMKVLDQRITDQQSTEKSLTLRLSAPAGTTQTLWLRINRPQASLRSTGITISDTKTPLQRLQIEFPAGTGYVEKEISFKLVVPQPSSIPGLSRSPGVQ